MVWVADREFASAANRACLTRGAGHCIHAEKLRPINTFRVKGVSFALGGKGGGEGGTRAKRFVICRNPEQAERDAAVRANNPVHLEG